MGRLLIKVLKAFQILTTGLTSIYKSLLHLLKFTFYYLSGKRPWALGYGAFKSNYLNKVLGSERILRSFLTQELLPLGYGHLLDARVVEIPWVLSKLSQQSGRLLDAGSSLNHEIVLKSPCLKGWETTIFTLAPEAHAFWTLGISYVYGDLRQLAFKDDWFDVIACISTIEHVGMDNTLYGFTEREKMSPEKQKFLPAIRELHRVLKPGGNLFITFPFGVYENHAWFQQFDASLTDILIKHFSPGRMEECVFYYDVSGWQKSDRVKAAKSKFFDVRKSKYFDSQSKLDFPPDRRAGEQAVMCLQLTKRKDQDNGSRDS